MEKMRSDVIKNIIIYILVIVLIASIFFRLDNYYIGDLRKQIYISSLISSKGYEIVDESGEDISQKYIVDQSHVDEMIRRLYIIQISTIIMLLITGFILIILDINYKFKKLDQATHNILKNIENLQVINTKDKYLEINNIYDNINEAIYSIQAKEDYKNTVIENLAHDILTPIHIIKGNIELYENNLEMDIDNVKGNLQKLSDLASTELSKKKYDYEKVSSLEIEKYFYIYTGSYTKVNFEIVVDKNIILNTKRVNFYRIVDNIVDNAIKHGKAKVIKITLNEKQDIYELRIGNDGKEIPKDDLDKIFSRNYTTNGNGIGLSIVKEMLNDLNYKIEVSSSVNYTEFIIYIPKENNKNLNE